MIPLALGTAVSGKGVTLDLVSLPNLLIAGDDTETAGLVNALLARLVRSHEPDALRLLMLGPPSAFSACDRLPLLLAPVASTPPQVLGALCWLEQERARRLRLFREKRVRTIATFNQRASQPLPRLVVLAYGLAELFEGAEDLQVRFADLLAHDLHAVGMHVIATTRYSGLAHLPGALKVNFPGRIAFRAPNVGASLLMLDEPGAEALAGGGEMLVARGGEAPLRVQAAWVSPEAPDGLCAPLKATSAPAFERTLLDMMERPPEGRPSASRKTSPEKPLTEEAYCQRALDLIRETGRCSVSMLQRNLNIGYNMARAIADKLEAKGLIPPGGNPPAKA